MQTRISRALHLFLIVILLGTCASSIYFMKTDPGDAPVPTLPPNLKFKICPASITGPDTNWLALQPGLERRLIPICDEQNKHVESVHIWRLNQNYFRLDVAFDGSPKSLESWQKQTNASLVMNGGYFSTENEKYLPNGLTIINGQTFGTSYQGYGGMLAIRNSRAELRWLVEKPYEPGQQFQAALQSFPMLVKPGGQLGFGAEREDYAKARRTVIAQDKNDRILFIVAPEGYFTLHQLSTYLTLADLHLDMAINLDGGGSTGILVANPREVIPSKVLLPFVILVYPR